MENRDANWLLSGALSVLLVVVVLVTADLPVGNELIGSVLVLMIGPTALAAIVPVLRLMITEVRITGELRETNGNPPKATPVDDVGPNIADPPARLPRLP